MNRCCINQLFPLYDKYQPLVPSRHFRYRRLQYFFKTFVVYVLNKHGATKLARSGILSIQIGISTISGPDNDTYNSVESLVKTYVSFMLEWNSRNTLAFFISSIM